ncbi:MAG: hypothetical protein HY678_01645 [Chloroflexi bacterium]|nr:hypothetical protein [Chloroflexota bacterium]
MATPPAILADNAAQLRRLQALTARLDTGDRDLGSGWTIGVVLAHLAFWDRRAVLLLAQWRKHGSAADDHPDDGILNDALLDEWRLLTVRQAGELALSAAKAVNAAVEALDSKTADAIIAVGDGNTLLHRGAHRREHLDQIEGGTAV